MPQKPIIYQVMTRLFGNTCPSRKPNGTIVENGCGKMNDFDAATLESIRRLGANHVWYTGIIRHATTTDYTHYGIPQQTPMVVKGKAGSPYAITDYYDVDPDLAVDVDKRMEEFMALVKRTHKAGMKVVLDFVPNHVAREYHSIMKPETVKDLGEDDNSDMHFSTSNNFYYCWGQPLDTSRLPHQGGCEDLYVESPAKATGNDHFDNCPGPNDWYETVKLNYGIDYCDAGGRSEHFSPIPDTWSKMTNILLFWAAKGIDAFRCDMAEMVPPQFWAWATDKVKFVYPHVKFIGEVYDPGQYRRYLAAGFDYLYDKVGMYDCLRDVICHRRPASDITQQWQVNDDILAHTLYFLENHDEQRLASEFFAADARKGIPGLIVSALLNPNAMMVYAGQELGERGMDVEGFSGHDGRTTIFDYWSVDTIARGYYDRRRLKKQERELRDLYSKVLRMANEEPALREGVFYDLMYVNPQLAERQFAFLRKAQNELFLIVVNFDDTIVNTSVKINHHAFEWLGLPQRCMTAKDMLSDNEYQLNLEPDMSYDLSIDAHYGLILKMIL